jgi:hypothetical protein
MHFLFHLYFQADLLVFQHKVEFLIVFLFYPLYLIWVSLWIFNFVNFFHDILEDAFLERADRFLHITLPKINERSESS